MGPEKDSRSCIACGRGGLPPGRDVHDACRPGAKAQVDAVLRMLHERHGDEFSVVLNGHRDGSWSVHTIGPGPAPVPQERETVGSAFLEEPCICQKDADNRCQACIDVLCAFIKNMAALQQEFQEKLSRLKNIKEVCEPCGRQYADHALAKMVKEVFQPASEGMGPAVVEAVRNMTELLKGAFGPGIRSWPLLEKALESFSKAAEEEEDDG